MPDVLIRGLTTGAVARIDAEATNLGLSRNEFLRRKLEERPIKADEELTEEHWKRSAEVFRDLGDPEVMAGAWR